jgi:AraC-like DNA-binding protein
MIIMNTVPNDDFSYSDMMDFEWEIPPDPDIVEEFRSLLEEQKCEEVLSGYFKYELSLCRCIANGNIESLKKQMHNTNFHLYSSCISDDKLSQARYMYATSIAIIARAAICGGLPAIYAYTLGDAYAGKSEKCMTISQLWHYFNMAILDFTNRVKKTKLRIFDNYNVRECAVYISSHIFDKITLKDAAARCHITVPYLSSIFKESTGMNFNEYVKREKMKMAAMFLVDSTYSVADIADRLAFSSSSALSSQFRSVYGVSPSEYRTYKSSNKSI